MSFTLRLPFFELRFSIFGSRFSGDRSSCFRGSASRPSAFCEFRVSLFDLRLSIFRRSQLLFSRLRLTAICLLRVSSFAFRSSALDFQAIAAPVFEAPPHGHLPFASFEFRFPIFGLSVLCGWLMRRRFFVEKFE